MNDCRLQKSNHGWLQLLSCRPRRPSAESTGRLSVTLGIPSSLRPSRRSQGPKPSPGAATLGACSYQGQRGRAVCALAEIREGRDLHRLCGPPCTGWRCRWQGVFGFCMVKVRTPHSQSPPNSRPSPNSTGGNCYLCVKSQTPFDAKRPNS